MSLKSFWSEQSARRRAVAWERTIRATCRFEEHLARERDPSVFSVLIAARAAERHLADCLDSILRTSLPPGVELEVVVAVDGCESTLVAAQRYVAALPADAAGGVRVLHFRQHCGLFVIRNSLLMVSRGSFALFVDADDALMPGALSTLHAFAVNCAAVAPSFLIRPMSAICDAQLAPMSGKRPRLIKGAIGISKTALEALGGFAPWPCAGDRDFLRRAERADIPVFAMPEPLVLYRQHDGQLTRSVETGMKTKLRAHYWKEVERRSARGVVKERPLVGIAVDVSAGEPAR
ncbi:MAG: glycosyltransferase family 2 protein [Kiritimatiellae bacterium]|nr:glycosyltransferase family 2 protein [Kiritimatiellia bacterium]MCO5067370.1 glycosyltransferase family 2 protein [Kiritimatiellia bacterium]